MITSCRQSGLAGHYHVHELDLTCFCLHIPCRRVHTFTSLDSQGAEVTCIEPSPALDVAAVGLSDGRVQVKHRTCTKEFDPVVG